MPSSGRSARPVLFFGGGDKEWVLLPTNSLKQELLTVYLGCSSKASIALSRLLLKNPDDHGNSQPAFLSRHVKNAGPPGRAGGIVREVLAAPNIRSVHRVVHLWKVISGGVLIRLMAVWLDVPTDAGVGKTVSILLKECRVPKWFTSLSHESRTTAGSVEFSHQRDPSSLDLSEVPSRSLQSWLHQIPASRSLGIPKVCQRRWSKQQVATKYCLSGSSRGAHREDNAGARGRTRG